VKTSLGFGRSEITLQDKIFRHQFKIVPSYALGVQHFRTRFIAYIPAGVIEGMAFKHITHHVAVFPIAHQFVYGNFQNGVGR
jgi:hypothetical protein